MKTITLLQFPKSTAGSCCHGESVGLLPGRGVDRVLMFPPPLARKLAGRILDCAPLAQIEDGIKAQPARLINLPEP